MTDGQRLLFSAETRDDEARLRELLDEILAALDARQKPESTDILIAFDRPSAGLLAWLLEIGSAPGEMTLVSRLRSMMAMTAQVRVHFSRETATEVARVLRVGISRHEAGVDDPVTFRLH